MRIRLEQMRQARRIHGGLVNMWGASVGVRLSRCPIPSRRLRRRIFGTIYGEKYPAISDEELEKPLDEYRSLNELFTRGVPDALRPRSQNAANEFVVPCDSTVQDAGLLADDTLLTVKGIEYQISSLAPQTDVTPFRNGNYAILFLSPRDCHRVFSPQSGTLDALTHVPGYRLLVHPPYQRREFPVFTLNERLVMELTTPLGRCLLIMVAGWGVGHITHPFATGLKPASRRITRVTMNRTVESGEWLATFELGSTVVLITEPQVMKSVAADQVLRYGETLLVPQADEESASHD